VCVFKVNPDAGDVGVTPFYCQALPVSLANPRQTGFAGLANPDLDPRTDRTVSLNPTRIQIRIQQIEYSIRNTWGDSDAISFHIYASWFSPPSFR